MKRYEIEYMFNDVVEDLLCDYPDLNNDFYGDSIPDEIRKIENELEFTEDKNEIEEHKEEIRNILLNYIKSYYCIFCDDDGSGYGEFFGVYPNEDDAIEKAKELKFSNENVEITITNYYDLLS